MAPVHHINDYPSSSSQENDIVINPRLSSTEDLIDATKMSDYAEAEVKRAKYKPEEQPQDASREQIEVQSGVNTQDQKTDASSSQETMTDKEASSPQEAKGNLPLELSFFQSKTAYWQLVFTIVGVIIAALAIAITIAIFLFSEQNKKIDFYFGANANRIEEQGRKMDFYFGANAAKIEDLQELVKEQTAATKEMRKEILQDVNSRVQLNQQLNDALRERDFILLEREIEKVRQELNLSETETPLPSPQQD